MENGTFNSINRIGKVVIKVSKGNDELAQQVMKEMNSKSVKEYARDINMIGISTGKVYFNFNFFNRNIILQEFIKGKTVQEILLDNDISYDEKMEVYNNFLQIYSKLKNQNNLCLDWNMKNFIVSENEIYYIDFVPSLYKDKIEKVTAPNLLQYKESYLNDKVQISGILGYAIMSFLKNESKETATYIYLKLKQLSEVASGLCLDDNNYNHVYIYKLKKIEEYLHSDMTYQELLESINEYSMENISKVKGRIRD